VFTLLEQPSAVDTSYTFVLTNGTAGSADYTTTDVIVTVPAGATTGTVSVPTTADTIDDGRNFSIANGTVSATGTIIDNNNAPTVQRSLLLRLPKDLMWYSTLSNPSAVDTSYTFVLTNGTAEVRITTDVIVTVPAGATGTVSVPTTADTIDEVDETFSIANGTVSATGTIIDNNNAPTVATITASATEGSAAVFLYIKQPFCSRYFVYFDKWYGWKCGLRLLT
jgi:hypothetical protein